MPVTAKLSRKFYDALGEDVANELVEWFNLVDATYRLDLRDYVGGLEQRFEDKLGGLEQRFDSKLEQRLAEVKRELSADIAVVRVEVAGLRTDMAALRADLHKWMFLFWIGTIGMVGTILGLIKS